MLQRLTLVAGMSASSAATAVFTVSAASADTRPPAPATKAISPAHATNKNTIRASELPIYGEPEPVQFEVVPEKPSAYYTAISDARKWVWTYTDTIQGTTSRAKDIVNTSVQHSKDALQYIQEDSGVLPRAAVISVSGLGGIVAGYRGGFFRKTGYSSIAMAGAAALCYPNEAVDISKKTWRIVRNVSVKAYKDIVSSDKEKVKKVETADTKPAGQKAPSPAVVNKTSAADDKKENKTSKSNDSTVKKDFGMSNPQDKDMYTTRGK